jgi:ribosomal protein S18 acetylase RimI-like enzyme
MAKTPAKESSLKRDTAGRYVSPDGRFAVEQASGGWMVTDGEQANELGMPLVRGPFATLAVAKAAVEAARIGPAPTSDLAARMAALPAGSGRRAGTRAADRGTSREAVERSAPPNPEPPPIVIRALRRSDGPALRALWEAHGLLVIGDDDEGLATMARRNPGLLLVATKRDVIVGSALGGWDGRRGWIYHVAIEPGHRRRGIARRLVEQIEAGLRAVGCRKVNAIVMDYNDGGAAFWTTLGYGPIAARRYGREL